MTATYTVKQTKTINDAFALLTYIMDRVGWSENYNFDEAYRYEKKLRSTTTGKALCVEAFVKGFKAPTMPAHEVCGLSRGLQIVLCLGAMVSTRHKDYVRASDMKAFAKALEAHRASIIERLDAAVQSAEAQV